MLQILGLPKPIVHSNKTMVYYDAAKDMPDADEETILDHYGDGRWYTPVPSLHIVGMTGVLQFTVFLGGIFVYGPAKGAATSEIVTQVFKYGNVKGTILPPSLLEEMTKTPEQLDCLKRLTYVQYAGAPLSKPIGDLIVKDVKLMPCIGSTETGSWFPKVRHADDDEWDYSAFRPGTGRVFVHKTDGMYEFVFRRQPQYEKWQQVFHIFPHLHEFGTKDLFSKHPTKEDRWAYVGRLDDMVNFSNGQSIRASGLEAVIVTDPKVRTALVGGDARSRPFLILEMLEPGSTLPAEEQKEQVWPTIEKANEQCLDEMKLIKELTMLSKPEKPFPRTSKGTIARREVLKMYQGEIEALYAAAAAAASSGYRN
ncbi:MAG: hypothetical protein Q9191_008175 [Dirinaria sp. TL-2023a]